MTDDDRAFIVRALAAHAALAKYGVDGASAMMPAFMRAIAAFANETELKPKPALTMKTADGTEHRVRSRRAD